MRSSAASDSEPRESISERFAAGMTRAISRALLRLVIRSGIPVDRRRARYERICGMSAKPRGVDYDTDATRGGIPGESVTLKGSAPSARTILYLHGGGYCIGSAAASRVITGNLARRCDAEVFAANYRLAPEHPFPAALDDAVAAYRGITDAGVAPSTAVIAADSAGAGLAVATALQVRDLGLSQPAALLLMSPWVDLGPAALGPDPSGDVLSRRFVAECAIQYLAGRSPEDPLASPIRADLRGLPPTLIQVGGDELLLPHARRLAAALQAAGVTVKLEVYPRRWHVFQINAPTVADARRALDAAASFISSHVQPRGDQRDVA